MNAINHDKSNLILRQMHKDTPVYVPFMLIMKKDFTINFGFYFFSYLFRFIGIFVLSGSFIIDVIPAGHQHPDPDSAGVRHYLDFHRPCRGMAHRPSARPVAAFPMHF